MKLKKYPALPSELEDVKKVFEMDDTITNYGKTLSKDEKFYFHTEVGHGFAHQIYGSVATINFIENNIDEGCRNYLMDGTFKISPKPFKQTLVISIEYKNSVSYK